MKKIIIGISVGIGSGIIDIIPMIIQKLTWDANLSAFTMWIIIGFLTSTIELKLNATLKGLLIAFLVLLPSAVLIGWKDPISLIPIIIMTALLGSVQGFAINKLMNSNDK